jgi:hypothetical protein
METAIQVVWSIGLIGALALTLVILKQVALLLRVLRDIHQLAELTREAARGIASNVGTASRLVAATERAYGLRDSIHVLARAAGSFERKLSAPAAGPPGGD